MQKDQGSIPKAKKARCTIIQNDTKAAQRDTKTAQRAKKSINCLAETEDSRNDSATTETDAEILAADAEILAETAWNEFAILTNVVEIFISKGELSTENNLY